MSDADLNETEASRDFVVLESAETLRLDQSPDFPRVIVAATPSKSACSAASSSSASKHGTGRSKATPTPSKRILQSASPSTTISSFLPAGSADGTDSLPTSRSTYISKTSRKSPTYTNNHTSSSINKPKIMKSIKKGLVDMKSPKTQTFEKYLSVAATSMFDDDDDSPLKAAIDTNALIPSMSTPVVLPPHLQQQTQDSSEVKEFCSSNTAYVYNDVKVKDINDADSSSSSWNQGKFLLFKSQQNQANHTVVNGLHNAIMNADIGEKENLVGNNDVQNTVLRHEKETIIFQRNHAESVGDNNNNKQDIERSLEAEFIQPLPPMLPNSPPCSLSVAPVTPMLIKRDIISSGGVANDDLGMMARKEGIYSTSQSTGKLNRPCVQTQISVKEFLVTMLSEKDLSPYASFLLDGEGRSDLIPGDTENEDNAKMMENFMQMESTKLDERFEAIMQRHNSISNFTSDIV